MFISIKPSPTLLRFLAYARQPVYYGLKVAVASPMKTTWELFKVNLLSMLGLYILAIIFELIGQLMGIKEPESSAKDEWIFVLGAVIFAPLVEELISRWPLKYSNIGVVMMGLIGFWVIWGNFYEVQGITKTLFWVVFVVGTATIVEIINRGKNQIRNFWSTYFRWIYWTLALIFGLIHLSNYDGSQSSFLVYWPVLCIHQIIMGLLNGYARMRYGFWYGVALHAANNAIPAMLLAVELLTKK